MQFLFQMHSFYQMNQLISIDLSNNKITIIESNAISFCNAMKKITLIGNSIKEIHSSAFLQLNQLKDKLSCSDLPYLEFIQGNDNTHPALAEIIAIYLNVNKESYIVPLNHTECINQNKNYVLDMLKPYKFLVLDKKIGIFI